MKYELKDYQNEAVDGLYGNFERMLKSTDDKICVFQAPTGSGKTVVVANLLRKLVKEKKDQSLSFVWIAPRKLHDQSKDKLEKIYYDQILKCSNFEDLQDGKIDENEILFFNWESINKTNNIYIMDNEQDRNLSTAIQNTKDDGNKLILIIDESHYAAGGEKSLEIIHDLKPKITLEMSATPHLKQYDGIWQTDLADVIAEEMIKDDIIVNPEFAGIKVKQKDHDEIVIDEALKKREFLKKGFTKEGSNVNPLVLIQLPDKKATMEDKREQVVKILKDNHNITEENGKLGIWLSGEPKENLINIDKPDNEIQVLIFKQAISIGWDCPRASILVLFREYKSFEFTVQTLGRITRMPEPEIGFYDKVPELNKGYIFTNLEKDKIVIAQEYVKDYISLYESHRIESEYKRFPVTLRSIHLRRQRERTRFSGEFGPILIKILNSFTSKIDKNPSKLVKVLGSDGQIPNIDKTGQIHFDKELEVKSTGMEIQNQFDAFITSAISPFAPSRSSDITKRALYTFIQQKFAIDDWAKAQQIILGKENTRLFLEAINAAKGEYNKKVIGKLSEQREVNITPDWEVPKVMTFKNNCNELVKGKSIMEPFYSKKMSDPEEKFIEFLNNSETVEWWYKNGETESKFFSVPYIDENGKEMGFYVDWVIRFKDGTVGLFDTKSGRTAADAGTRHDGLYKYMQSENKKGKNLIGGIAVEDNGIWRYNNKKEYHFDENDMSGWKTLDF
tara:strand:+ start:5152 stop:7347 length:2196 start_codon:yes stop_codon:yes gene_type:complete